MGFPPIPSLNSIWVFLTWLHIEAYSLNKFSVENIALLSIPLPHTTSSCPRKQIRHPEPYCQAGQEQAGSLGELQLQF